MIIDDEPMARKGLAEDLEAIGLLSVQAVVRDTREATAILGVQPPDVIFLDIQMPGHSGLEFLDALQLKPMVILVTAYPQYALDGFERGVIDYLVKPVSVERLRVACQKAVEWHCSDPGQHLYLKCNGAFERVRVADILFVEAANNYIRVHLNERKLLIYQSLKGMEEQLPAGAFVQVHKSFLVARRHITQVKGDSVVAGGITVPLSRRYKSSALRELHLTNKSGPVK